MSINLDIQVPVQWTSEPGVERASLYYWTLTSKPSNGNPRFGQYACGSYWVAPAVGDTAVSVDSLIDNNGSEEHFLHLDADPQLNLHGLGPYSNWDENQVLIEGVGGVVGRAKYASNDPTKDDLPNLPITYTPPVGSCISLVASDERNSAEEGLVGEDYIVGGTSAIEYGAIASYCIVTILPDAPNDGANGGNSIRPNIVGATKELLTWDDFDLTKLPSNSTIGSYTSQQLSDANTVMSHSTEVFSMGSWDGSSWVEYSEAGRAFRAHILGDDYGAGRASRLNEYALWLCGTNTLEEKKPLLAAMVSSGLDIYHSVYDIPVYRNTWRSGAGQWTGQYTAPVFATCLLNDSVKSNVISKIPAISISSSNFEDGGPQEIKQYQRGVTGMLLWGDKFDPVAVQDSNPAEIARRHWAEIKDNQCYDGALGTCNVAGGGNRTAGDPCGYIDGPPNPGTGYMQIAAGSQRAVAALMLVFPSFRATVNYDALIEYSNRYSEHGIWTLPDPVAAPSDEDALNESCEPFSGGSGCTNYGVDWGPTPTDWRYGIEGGSGRFASDHGVSIGVAFSVALVEDNWSTFYSLYDGIGYLERKVPNTTCVTPDVIVYFEGSDYLALVRSGTWDTDIRYTTDGTEPTESDALYSGSPINLGSSEGYKLKVKSFKSGLTESKTITVTSSGQLIPETPSTMTNPDLTTTKVQAALDSIKADCDTLNALGVGTSTITASDLTNAANDNETEIAVQKTNQDNLNTDNSLGLTLTVPSGDFEDQFQDLHDNNVSIEAALA